MLDSPTKAMIYVVDDDPDVLGSLQFLLETDGFAVRTFKSGAALLGDKASDEADCFIIDYKMPNMNGLDLQRELAARGVATPIVFITAYGEVACAVTACKAGAADSAPASDACRFDHELGREPEQESEQDEPGNEVLRRHPPVDRGELEHDEEDRAGG